ncbi:MAG: hypothetical protein AAFY56_09260, partial [Pseudomonadota bacterium]
MIDDVAGRSGQPAAPLESENIQLTDNGWIRFLENRAALVSVVIFLVLALAALLAPILPLLDPIEQHYGDEFLPPDGTYWFGTDDFGRDIFSRCIWGMRLSLTIGVIAAVAAGLFGTSLGMIQGLFRGWIDEVLGRIWDTLMATARPNRRPGNAMR